MLGARRHFGIYIASNPQDPSREKRKSKRLLCTGITNCTKVNFGEVGDIAVQRDWIRKHIVHEELGSGHDIASLTLYESNKKLARLQHFT